MKKKYCLTLSCLPFGLQNCFQAIWSFPLYKISLAVHLCLVKLPQLYMLHKLPLFRLVKLSAFRSLASVKQLSSIYLHFFVWLCSSPSDRTMLSIEWNPFEMTSLFDATSLGDDCDDAAATPEPDMEFLLLKKSPIRTR